MWHPIKEYKRHLLNDALVGLWVHVGDGYRWIAETASYNDILGWVATDGRILYPTHYAEVFPPELPENAGFITKIVGDIA